MYTLEEQADCLAVLDDAGAQPVEDTLDDTAWVAQYVDWYQLDEVHRALDVFPRPRR